MGTKRKATKKELRKELSDLLNAEPSLDKENFHIRKKELRRLLFQLIDYKKTNEAEIKGKRPTRYPDSINVPERDTGYRMNLSDYIKENTRIELPVSSKTESRVYNLIADFLKI